MNPRIFADHALSMAASSWDTPEVALKWLAVAGAWEGRIPQKASSGFATIDPKEDETHRIVLCISPKHTIAVLDPRWGKPHGVLFPSTAEAIQFALAALDKDLSK